MPAALSHAWLSFRSANPHICAERTFASRRREAYVNGVCTASLISRPYFLFSVCVLKACPPWTIIGLRRLLPSLHFLMATYFLDPLLLLLLPPLSVALHHAIHICRAAAVRKKKHKTHGKEMRTRTHVLDLPLIPRQNTHTHTHTHRHAPTREELTRSSRNDPRDHKEHIRLSFSSSDPLALERASTCAHRGI